jgi:hypothetical protein
MVVAGHDRAVDCGGMAGLEELIDGIANQFRTRASARGSASVELGEPCVVELDQGLLFRHNHTMPEIAARTSGARFTGPGRSTLRLPTVGRCARR